VALQGLIKNYTVPVAIKDVPPKGRGVFAAAPIKRGSFVCEYKTTKVYPRSQIAKEELQYAANNEPCMVLDVETSQGWFTLDATRKFSSIGRLLNHAPARKATVKPFKALLVGKKWRVALLAARDIAKGEELVWDYGCPPEGRAWLMRVRTQPTLDTQLVSMDAKSMSLVNQSYSVTVTAATKLSW